jgi:P63C domain
MIDGDAKGKAKGGIARAASLTEDQRIGIAKKAAIARWGAQATHKGNFREDFGIDIECYVLDDDKKTAVISQIGMGLALGLSPRGNAFPRFLESKGMQKTVSAQLAEKLAKPVKFQWSSGGAQGQSSSAVHGYDVTLLIDVCKAIIQADDLGILQFQQKNVAKQAHIIMGASAKSGIENLVYKLSGYDTTKEQAVAAFKLYVREEARDYEKEFPPQLYQQWYRLYQLQPPERNKPWKFKHLTVDQVYKPLAKSNGKILQLAQSQRSSGTERNKRLHQFLSDIGVKALRQHLGELIGIAKLSKDREEYEKNVEKIFGDEPQFDF